MQLDDRLQAMADLVPAGSTAADIGTDHGYLAVALLKENKVPMVIASDKNQGPYEAAKRTVAENNLNDQISVRLGDGLAVIKPGEADTACIAGMGGGLMTEILKAAPAVTATLKTLVLQPMNGDFELRQWLYSHGWYIDDEVLAVADGKQYIIMRAKPGVSVMPTKIELIVGPALIKKALPLIKNHLNSLIDSRKRILKGMEKSMQAKKNDRYQEIKQELQELEELQK